MEDKVYKLSETLISNLESTARISKISAIRYFNEHKDMNITFHEFVIIDALYNFPNIHQRDLAKKLYIGTANLSRDLEKLEKRGLIQRNTNLKDKRMVKTLTLTDIGNKMYLDINGTVYQHVKDIESVLTNEEYNSFLNLLSKIKNKLTEDGVMVFE